MGEYWSSTENPTPLFPAQRPPAPQGAPPALTSGPNTGQAEPPSGAGYQDQPGAG